MPAFIHSLTIERPTDTGSDDEYGQPVRTYAELATVDGLIQPKTQREMALASDAGPAIGEHTIFMGRRDITTADRIRYGGDVYEITGIRDLAFGNLAHLEIDARRIVTPALALGS